MPVGGAEWRMDTRTRPHCFAIDKLDAKNVVAVAALCGEMCDMAYLVYTLIPPMCEGCVAFLASTRPDIERHDAG